MASLQLINSAPSSESVVDDMTALMVLDIVNTAPFLGGSSVFVDINKFPPAMLIYFELERREALLWPARIISLAWYVIIASGWVAA